MLIFRRNEKQLHRWLEIEFSSEIELLQMIHKGRFSDTRAGAYLASLKTRFAPEPIVDMYCYIQLYLELSIKAKRNVLLKESVISPLIRMNYRDLWKLNQFRELVYSSNTPKLIQISFQEPLDG
ncbi:MAG TPA: hypothetical protein VJ871_02930 [Bacteroidales bacterium]|nr:hypothetical protein [Bacteroidales bacterium]